MPDKSNKTHPQDASASDRRPGGLQRIGQISLRLLLARMELASLELAELRDHSLRMMLTYLLAAISAGLALAFGAAMGVALAWDRFGWISLFAAALLFLLLLTACLLMARRFRQRANAPFGSTFDELRADLDLLL